MIKWGEVVETWTETYRPTLLPTTPWDGRWLGPALPREQIWMDRFGVDLRRTKVNSGRGSCDRECDWLVFRGVYEGREVSVNPYLKIPSKQRPGLNDIGCEFFEWRGQWRLNVMTRSHYHLRFRGSFGGEGLVIIRVVVRSSPELVLLAWSGWGGVVWL